MAIDPAIAQALHVIASRERDLSAVYTPGAQAANSDVFHAATASPDVDPMSASAPPGSYFARRADDGRRVYSSDGKLLLRGDCLVDADGYAVLGVAPGSPEPRALTLDAVDLALGRVQNLHITSDGAVRYDRAVIDPRTHAKNLQNVLVGRLSLARFPAGTHLTALDASHAVAPPGVLAHLGQPNDGSFAGLLTFHRTGAAINIDKGIQRLQEAYLALDALEAAHKASGSVAKTTLDLIK